MKKGINIESVSYKGPSKRIGSTASYVDYLENEATMTDGSEEIRLGILRISGRNIREVALTLGNAVSELDNQTWWSLQTTNPSEVKAVYRVGFRHIDIAKGLEDHLNAFYDQGGTLLMELNTKRERII